MKASIKQYRSHQLQIAIALGLVIAITGCGKKEEAPATPATAAPVAASAQTPAIPPASAIPTSWTAEALEELLAPIALYPDPILTQVLVAAGNPQEVLDAGNWLLQNENLKGAELEQAGTKVGFTPPAIALLQFPATLDMMCQEMGWTTELGQAFATDQEGVLAAVQRLRAQALEVGNLKTSPEMTVAMETIEGDDGTSEDVIYLKPTDPEVIYVPQYDPVATYAPAPTTTTVVQEGHSDSAMVTTALLAFGAGMLVNEIFDDDDYDYYYPRYGYGGYYGYNRYPYRPVYGNGYYPNHGYNRPPGYNSGWNNNGWQNNNNGWQNNGNINTGDININTGGNRYSGSPISKANPNRDMSKVNQRQTGNNANRQGANTGKSDWKGQNSYAGAKGTSKGKPTADMVNKGREQARTTQGSYAGKQQPKQQGGYAGANRDGNNTRDMQKPSSGSRDVQKPQQQKQKQQKSQQQGDRGRTQTSGSKNTSRQQPQQQNRQSQQRHSGGGGGGRNSAVSGSRSGGGSAKASSQRGQQSRSGSGGGGSRSKRN
ncbi:MAG TPA: DUF3300 domain-containing protein [Arenimonas sp.]|nr:DUF3300 domain-containing protein [Arenimonas sp.]